MEKNEYFADVGKYRKDKDYVKIWRRRGLIAGVILSLAFIIVQVFGIMSEYEKGKGIEVLSLFSDYYEFEPNSSFSSEALRRYGSAATSVMREKESVVYTKYLAKWSEEPDVDILRLELTGFYGEGDIRIYSYMNQAAYDMAWNDFKLPLSEGRWFEGAEDEVVCILGDDYEIGDVIKIDEKDGGFFFVTVVGKTCYPYLPRNTLPVKSGVHNSLYTPANDLEIFLLNPLSKHNEKSDMIAYNTTLIKTENEQFIRDNSQYGTFTSVERSLQKDKVSYVILVGEMVMGLIFFLLSFIITIHIKEDKWMLLWIWIAGVIGGFAGGILYFDANYKLLIVVTLCTVISLIWIPVHKKAGRHTVSGEIEVIVLQEEETL